MSKVFIRNLLRPYIPRAILHSLRKSRNKRDATHRRSLKNAAILKYGYIGSQELISALRNAGIAKGDVLFVQCSFNDMLTYAGSPMDLIEALLTLVGPFGTLLMPAFSKNTYTNPPRSFDVLSEPTYTGLVNELFRRTPGVLRSLHPRHSICGLGPQAEAILSGHENCIRANGPDSPFDRMRKLDNSNILTLGLPPGYVSFLHWVDDYEPEKLPFVVHKSTSVSCEVTDTAGRRFFVRDWHILDNKSSTLDYSLIAAHLTAAAMNFWQLSSMDVGIYKLKTLSNELINLRERLIYHYK